MARDLVVHGFGSVEAMRKYAAGIHSAIADISDFEGTPILKLGEDGEWTFGAENILLDDKDVLAVNPRSLRHGYIAFDQKSNSLAETVEGEPAEIVVPITEALYAEELPELEAPKRGDAPVWRKQIIVEMVIVAGPNKGETLVYKPTSQGGRRMLAKLAREIAHRLEDEQTDVVPVVQLFSSTYYNKRFSRDVVTPELSIEKWLPLDATSVEEGAARKKNDQSVDVDEEDGDARKTRRRGGRDATNAPKAGRRSARAAEPEPEPETDDDEDEQDEPRGRRRAATRDADDGRGERRGRAARDEEPADDDEDAEPEQPRGRRGRAAATDERRRPASDERRGRRARDDEEESDDDDDTDRRGSDRRRTAAPSRGGRDRDSGEGRRVRDERSAPRGDRRSRDADNDRGSEDGVRGRRAAAGSRSAGRDVPAREDRRGRRAA